MAQLYSHWLGAEADRARQHGFHSFGFISYPISHSLIAAVGWATVFAAGYYWLVRYRSGAVMIWIGVVSHWFLDVATHRPDLPLYPGGALQETFRCLRARDSPSQ